MEDSQEPIEHYLANEEEAKKAAFWFSHLNLNNVQVLYVYGAGLGYAYDAAKQWLRQDGYRSLVFLEENPKVIQRILETEQGKRLLRDPQAALHFISENLSELDEIVIPYSVFSFTVSCLEDLDPFKKQRYSEIKSLIAFFADYYRSAMLGYAQGGLFFFNNYFNNILKLPSAYNGEPLAGKFKDIPAIICGAGPSLDKNIDILRKLHSRAMIFAGATAINVLNANGIVPHAGVGLDPNPEQLTRLIINQGHEMPFFYRNRIHHRALEMIHGDKIWISGSPGFKIGSWMEKKLHLPVSQNTMQEGYNVLNFALALAHYMGCNPIILVGVDLAYSQGLSYASGINVHPLHNREVHFRSQSPGEQVLNKKDIFGQPVRTLWKWLRESFWFGLFEEEHPDALIINATEGGIGFPGIQNIPLAEVAAKYLLKQYDISTQLHGEIQNSQWPKKLKEKKIIDLLFHLSNSLKRCVEKYTLIERELSLFPAHHISINKIAKEIKREEAFPAMLQDIEESSLRFTSLERQRLKLKKAIPKEEIANRQHALDSTHYGLLKKTAYSNALLLDAIIKDHQVRATTALPPSKKKRSSKKIQSPASEGVYIFENQCMTLQDSELGLDYSETFPANAYLRKEQIFYPEGKVKVEQFYQGMFLHGPSTFFGQDGQVLAQAWFVHGQQQGKMWTYFASGQVHSKQRFRDGKKHGKQEFFYSNATLKMILHYKCGRLHSDIGPACSIYHANGVLAREQYFVNGLLEGFERIWNKNGQLEIEAEYFHNRPINMARQWHVNSQLACEIVYGNNSQRISARYWDAEGNSISEKEYEKENYFKTFSKNAQKLANALEDVVKQVSTLIPNVQESIYSSISKKDQLDFAEDLEELQQEMSRLQELGQVLGKESTLETIEEYWFDPSNQAMFKQELLNQQQKLAVQMKSIDQGLRNMLQKMLQSNEDKQNE